MFSSYTELSTASAILDRRTTRRLSEVPVTTNDVTTVIKMADAVESSVYELNIILD